MSKSGLDNYVVKRSERPLLEEVAWSRLPCPIFDIKEAKLKRDQSLEKETRQIIAIFCHFLSIFENWHVALSGKFVWMHFLDETFTFMQKTLREAIPLHNMFMAKSYFWALYAMLEKFKFYSFLLESIIHTLYLQKWEFADGKWKKWTDDISLVTNSIWASN